MGSVLESEHNLENIYNYIIILIKKQCNSFKLIVFLTFGCNYAVKLNLRVASFKKINGRNKMIVMDF